MSLLGPRVPAAAGRARDRLRRSCAAGCCASPASATPSRSDRAHRRPRPARGRPRAGRRCSSRSSSRPPGSAIILPILKDAGETSTPFGQVVVAGASIAEVGADRPALALLLGRVGRRRRQARAPDRASRSSSLAVGVAMLGAGALDAGLADAARAAGHDRRDPRARRVPAARGLRRRSPRSSASRRSSAPSSRARR